MVTMAEIHSRVAAPPVTPHPFGLFSVAAPIAPGDTAWAMGLSWESWACINPNFTGDLCIDGVSPDPKEFEACPDTQIMRPVTVYLGVRRSGGDDRVAVEQASSSLSDAEEYAVEKYLWDQLKAESDPLGTALDPLVALGTVEKLLGQGYMGTGVIHMDRLTATVLSDNLVQRGSQLVTTIGTPVVVGAGYDYDNTTAGAIFGTGALAVRRGTVATYTAWNLAINDQLALAERTYVVGWDCFIVGRQATLTGGP